MSGGTEASGLGQVWGFEVEEEVRRTKMLELEV